ncbi:MAG: NAD(P)H-binding protein [Myxococcales bacterium]|nr:NAD(P)H-binding protein [Myxococcales bacterium]MDH5306369.1 NAD(P)H-binding protein [Myxococcales bacterium]MDH5565379.1 NAD(P)H-binding protein [Myxococcales bacterium]
MPEAADRILVTGANGHLGRLLLCRLAGATPRRAVHALVRSERAAESLRNLPADARPEIDVIDYRDAAALARAARGCSQAVHLVGILKQSRRSRYEDAHEGASAALADAAARAGLRRIVGLSILGAHPDAGNACLASRGRADAILLRGKTPAVIVRLPMVLGAGDAAAQALLRQASAGRTALVRGGAARQQPIAARDVVEAILAALTPRDLDGRTLDLAGPESLTQRALVERAAALLGKRVAFRSIPLFAARFAAAAAELLLADPPITRAMLGVLEQDDDIDPGEACRLLGIELTPLDETLRLCLAPGAERS